MLGRTLAALGLMAAIFTSSAHAAVIQDFSGLASATNGIVLGPDGNFWVSEENSGSVARMTPAGAVLAHYPVGTRPTSIATGPGGRVWVSVTDGHKLVWFDATSATPTAHDVPMPVACGPVAIVDGGDNNMYFSLPGCPQPRLGTVKADGTGQVSTATGVGQVFDLAVSNGKLFVPDFDNDAVYRVGLGTTLTKEASIGANGAPDGIAADGAGNLWVTLYNSGHVGQFAATQNLGTVVDHAPGETLSGAFGIVAGADGRIYVTAKDSGKLARIDADGSFRVYATNSQPFQIVNGPDNDLYFTDQASTRVQRFVSNAPRPATITASAVSDSVGSVTGTVDSRGNDTQVVFEYGPTTAYGSTSAPMTVGAGTGAAAVTVALAGLAPGTTYHVRLRATNEEGTATGADTTFATPAAPVLAPPTRTLAARTTFSWAFVGSRTALRKVDISGLVGGETARVTCSGKGCPFKTKTYKNLKKGKKALGSRFGLEHKLRKGAKIEVRVTKPGTVGSSALLTVRKRRQDPKIVRSCLMPG
ncbi:MAG TPA: hypothetical protein VI300_19345, partial [Solirubrobacter sp.]